MILTPHIIVGAVIGAKIHNLWLIIILGLASHFVLDRIYHWEYSSNNKSFKNFRETRDFKSLLFFIGRILIDALIGTLIVFLCLKTKNLLDWNSLKYILIGCFFAILPDIILGTSFLFKDSSFSKKYLIIHTKYLHFKKETEKEGMITFLGIFSQIAVIAISLLLLVVF